MNDTRQNIRNADGHENPEVKEKQATGKQFVAAVFVLSIAAKMFLFPIFLIQTTGRDAYIAVATACAFDLIMLGLLIAAVYKSGEHDFFSLLTSVFGKIGAKIIVVVIALFMFFKLNIGVAESLMFYSDSLFTDFSVPIMIFVLLIFFIAVGKHTLRAFCRLNELLVPLIVVGLGVLITIVLMTGYDFSNVLPFLRDGVGFGSELAHHTAWVGDFTPLVLFMGRTKMQKRTAVCASIGGTIGAAVVVFFALVLCAAFGNVPMLVDTSTNISSILQFSVGNIYGRTDMFSSVLWSVSAFIQNALFFYSVCRCIAFVIGKNSHIVIGLAACIPTYFFQVFAMTDQTLFSAIVTSTASSAIVPILSAAIAIIAVVCAFVGSRKVNGSRNITVANSEVTNE